jgi:hypothetical protein
MPGVFMMTTFVSEAARIQLLVPLLTLGDLGSVVLTKLKSVGEAYKWSYQSGTLEQRCDVPSAFVKATYGIARVFATDRPLYNRFDGSIFVREEDEQQDPKAVDIFESVLLYSLDAKSRRWRDYSSKIARIFELLSNEGLSSDDVVNRLEAVGGIAILF